MQAALAFSNIPQIDSKRGLDNIASRNRDIHYVTGQPAVDKPCDV